MAALSVGADRLVARHVGPPIVEVIDDPGRWCAVEVAARPEGLLGGTANGAAWASWTAGLRPPGKFEIPADDWAVLRLNDRLYYRANSSASAGAWIDHRTTTTDAGVAAAPSIRLCDAWIVAPQDIDRQRLPQILKAAADHPRFADLERGTNLAAIVCLHRFSARRPAPPDAWEWAVVLACQGQGVVNFLVERRRYQSLELIAPARFRQAQGDLQPAGAVPMATFGSLPAPEAAGWPRHELGPFLVLQELSPPPDAEGGTCILTGGPGTNAYSAMTRWSGPQEILEPR